MGTILVATLAKTLALIVPGDSWTPAGFVEEITSLVQAVMVFWSHLK